MPAIDPVPFDGRIPKGDKLRRQVDRLLAKADHVIALTDVYTGAQPSDFEDADDAKSKMRAWVGDNPRFSPHAAQFDFEAWLLPYWEKIKRIAGSNHSPPGTRPEHVNNVHPPSHRIREVFRTGERGRAYVKTRDADRILNEEDLLVSANACTELKAFLNTIITLCNGVVIE